MPISNICVPEGQLAIERELRENYGGHMTKKQVAVEMGFSVQDYTAVNKWLDGVRYVDVNGRKKWPVREVARKIHRNTYA